eukprot:CAMPEP_0182571820 /NCGR_PEP_ID=MMETSP1324-20130603/15093_1 /TAXON_ID=236786 /ORGANISM="Florenciella sp., Strain RCC1587" /LENGTH=80 /DNA_ID=CAMNT_0024786567 /DNA_START=57 /DNA_END=300 /DNA_ORIENTATION=+
MTQADRESSTPGARVYDDRTAAAAAAAGLSSEGLLCSVWPSTAATPTSSCAADRAQEARPPPPLTSTRFTTCRRACRRTK